MDALPKLQQVFVSGLFAGADDASETFEQAGKPNRPSRRGLNDDSRIANRVILSYVI